MHSKLTSILSVIIFFLCLAPIDTLAAGFQNEPNGFRGIKWGTNIKTLKDMKYLINYEDVIDMYSRDKDKLFFGKAKIGSIHYIFYKDKFFAVRIHTDGAKEFEVFKKAIFKQYGEGQHPERIGNLERWIWYGKITDMVLEYNLSNEETIFHMWSVEIEEEIEKE